jgi:hypothetical protein
MACGHASGELAPAILQHRRARRQRSLERA